jgi:hypothetical protein
MRARFQSFRFCADENKVDDLGEEKVIAHFVRHYARKPKKFRR